MATDPKKNDEIKDEELDKVSGGGALQEDVQTDGTAGGDDDGYRPAPAARKERA